jgi:hypothetical protein
MAQKTAWDGAALTESDINTYLMGEGGAWTSFTPQIDQGASTNIAKTVNYGKYARYGRTIIYSFTCTLTAAGSAGSAFSVTLPVAASSAFAPVGIGFFYDSSASTPYAGMWFGLSTTQVNFKGDWAGTASWGSTPNLALASGDYFYGQISYEAAS